MAEEDEEDSAEDEVSPEDLRPGDASSFTAAVCAGWRSERRPGQ